MTGRALLTWPKIQKSVQSRWKPHESLEESIQIINTVFLPEQHGNNDKKSGKIIGCVVLRMTKKDLK